MPSTNDTETRTRAPSSDGTAVTGAGPNAAASSDLLATGWSLRSSYLLVLAIVGLLSLVQFGLAHSAAGIAGRDAAVVNLAGRQRMLAERMARLVTEIRAARELPATTGALIDTCDAWRNVGAALREGDPVLDVPAPTVPAVVALLRRLQPLQDELHAEIEQFVGLVAGGDRDAIERSGTAVRDHVVAFVRLQDEAVSALESASRRRLDALGSDEIWLFAIVLLTLAVGGLLVFEPLVRRQRRQREQHARMLCELRVLGDSLAHLTDGIALVAEDGTIRYANDALVQWLGRSGTLGTTTITDLATRLAADRSCVDRLTSALRTGTACRERVRTGTLGARQCTQIELKPSRVDPAGGAGNAGALLLVTDATERDAIEQRLARSEERLRIANASGEIGVFEWSVPDDLLVWDETMFRIYGVDPNAFGSAYDAWRSCVVEADRQAAETDLQNALRDGTEFRSEFRIRRPIDGELRYVQAEASVLRATDGSSVRLVGVNVDVTERRAAENELRRSREQLQLVVDGAALGTWDWNVQTGEIDFNDRWVTMLGYAPGELVPHVSTWESLIHPDDDERTRRVLGAHVAGHTVEYRTEYRLRAKDGSWVWVLDCGRVYEWDAAGNAVRAAGIHLDVTDRRSIEECLRRSEDLLAETGRIARIGGFELDAETRTPLWSEEVYRIHEIPSDRRPDLSSALDHYPGEARNQIARAVERALSAAEPYDLELPFVTAKGTPLWVRTIGRPVVRDGRVVRVHGTFQDVTDRRVAADELKHALLAAEAASRAKSEFLANMSHEIRTPMTAILGYVDLLAESPDATAQQDYITTIRRNGDHLLRVLNDILDLSKIEAGRMEIERIQVAPAEFAAEVVDLMGMRAHGKGLTLDVVCRGELPATIATDPTRLRQILLNLIGNAIKFTEHGGVRLEVFLAAHDGTQGMLGFRVVDTGIGMTEDQVAALFRPFTQADTSTTRRFGGTGLGLTISRRFAQMLGGDIDLHSVPGVGSTFTVTVATGDLTRVPIEAAAYLGRSARGGARPTARDEAPTLSGRILLAEDGPDNQRLIAHVLRRAGADVTVVADGRQAVDRVLAESAGFDLVLMDMQMPELDGYAATQELRERGCQVPVVALTAHAMTGDRERCLLAGCNGYATKPIDRNALIGVCAEWLKSKPAVNGD